MARVAGRPPVPDASKVCAGCGVTFTHYQLPRRLSVAGWERRKFCTEPCRRDHELTYGRTSANFIDRLAARQLSKADHYAFWSERFDVHEIRAMGEAIALTVAA